MDKRYQVFISSTYTDLIAERNEVMQALLELECMPAGMELFPAANESQWNWIKKVIDESDYYIVIVAGRYGTISKDTGLSYTEMEYKYALETGKPVIGFLHKDITTLQDKFTEQSTKKRKQLQSFRNLVSGKLCKFYTSSSDLGAKVSRSITQLKKQIPAVGWIKADVIENFASSDEILALKKENELLKSKIYQSGIESPKESENLAKGNEQFEIDFCYAIKEKNTDTNYWRKMGDEWQVITLSWDIIFATIAPVIIGISLSNSWMSKEDNITKAINILIKQECRDTLEEIYPNKKISDYQIGSSSLDTILFQLSALNLITLTEGGWELTPFGHKHAKSLLAVHTGKTRSEYLE